MSLEREIEFFGRDIRIKQALSSLTNSVADFNGELGGTVWDSALVLIHYFENVEDFPLNFFRKKRVVELGAGTGLIGIALGLLGANVTVTDQAPLLDLLRANVELNNIGHNVAVKELTWGSDVSSLQPPVDVVILSDVVAETYKESYPKLLQTLTELTSRNTIILLAYEKRSREDLKFFQTLKNSGFDYAKVPDSKLDPNWVSDDIGIFRITKRS